MGLVCRSWIKRDEGGYFRRKSRMSEMMRRVQEQDIRIRDMDAKQIDCRNCSEEV